MNEETWPAIAVMGAGAVGCYFGGMLARAGAPVTLIGRPPLVESVNQEGLFIDSIHFQERVRLSASTEASAARGASVVLFCVKTLDTEAAARSLEPCVDPSAIVISLQNGVDNVERIRSATSIDPLAAAVYVVAEMTAPGCVRHKARGDLLIGDLTSRPDQRDERKQNLERLAALFERAGVPCRVSENIGGDLWTKLIMNCAYNAISALTHARYGEVAANELTRDVMRQVIEEGVAVAQAAGVRLPSLDFVEAGFNLANSMRTALSSTAHDLARGKRTEIDSLNGYVVRRGAQLGIATPTNHVLHALVRLREDSAALARG